MTQKLASNILVIRHHPLDWTLQPTESLSPDVLQFYVQPDDCHNRSEMIYIKLTYYSKFYNLVVKI